MHEYAMMFDLLASEPLTVEFTSEHKGFAERVASGSTGRCSSAIGDSTARVACLADARSSHGGRAGLPSAPLFAVAK